MGGGGLCIVLAGDAAGGRGGGLRAYHSPPPTITTSRTTEITMMIGIESCLAKLFSPLTANSTLIGVECDGEARTGKRKISGVGDS
jgi:hypothetical protein